MQWLTQELRAGTKTMEVKGLVDIKVYGSGTFPSFSKSYVLDEHPELKELLTRITEYVDRTSPVVRID